MSDRLKLPPERDFGFYRRRKHDKWGAVMPPALEAPVADSHAHVQMLPDPAWELARCAANGVGFVCLITDPSEDGPRPFDELDEWLSSAREGLMRAGAGGAPRGFPQAGDGLQGPLSQVGDVPQERLNGKGLPEPPTVRIAAGVHPHNARLFTREVERELQERLADARVVALGEIGLDFHYDLSPRESQRDVFRRQIRMAKQAGLPIALHLRGGEDSKADDAHGEALAILRKEGALGPGTLLHCCALGPDELRPWVQEGCYIAYGGAITFRNGDAARAGAAIVPADRLLLETDAPYMAPEPMRGAACTPAHVVFTAAALAEARGIAPGQQRRAFLQQLYSNTLSFYRLADQ